MTKEEFYNLLGHTEYLNNETLAGLKELIDQYPYFQSCWLLYLKSLKVGENQEFQDKLKKGALRVPDREQLYNFIIKKTVSDNIISEQPKPDSYEYRLEGASYEKKGDSLIDKFLSSEPSPIRIKSESFDNEGKVSENELIERSDDENDEIVTETLAMIYFEQKKYDKALNAFKKLSLKYPEKSIYFATRIAEIEQLKNI